MVNKALTKAVNNSKLKHVLILISTLFNLQEKTGQEFYFPSLVKISSNFTREASFTSKSMINKPSVTLPHYVKKNPVNTT